MKHKILVVDDEELARKRILNLIGSYPQAEFEIREARNGVEALAVIAEFNPEIVFLDIEMPEMSGIDVLLHLKDFSFKAIFQTAHDEFAAKAFELAACDYLLKPYSQERLHASLARALADLVNDARLARLERQFIEQRRYMQRFVIKAGARNRVVDENEVWYFLSEDHVTLIHLQDISYAYEHSLTLLQSRLDPTKYLRVHKNALVNMTKVTTYSQGRPMSLTLSNGAVVGVSRQREKNVREFLAGEPMTNNNIDDE